MIKDLREFIIENYYEPLGFIKEESYYPLKKQRKKMIY